MLCPRVICFFVCLFVCFLLEQDPPMERPVVARGRRRSAADADDAGRRPGAALLARRRQTGRRHRLQCHRLEHDRLDSSTGSFFLITLFFSQSNSFTV